MRRTFPGVARAASSLLQTPTPTVNVIGAFLGGGNSSQFVSDNQDNFEIQNYTSVLTGKHLIKFGARLRDGREANYANSNFNGTFTFDSLTSYQITEQGIANGLTPEQIRAAWAASPASSSSSSAMPAIAVNQFRRRLVCSG